MKKSHFPFWKKVLRIFCILLIACLTPVLLINVIILVQSFFDSDTVPDLFGVTPMVVVTDSMTPVICGGDMIVDHKVPAEEIKEGDIISFFDPLEKDRSRVITHRVIFITEKDGEICFRTRGDANNTADDPLVPASLLVGRYAFRIPILGHVVLFMRTPLGILLAVVLPFLILLLSDSLYKKKEQPRCLST